MAAGVINSGSAPKLLWPGLEAIFGQTYAQHSDEYKELFETRDATKSYEEIQEVVAFGLARQKESGAGVTYDTWRQGFTHRFDMRPFALGFQCTREELDDLQYKQVAEQRTKALAFSLGTTKEIVASGVYNNGFDVNFPGGDGVPLFSAAHVTDVGNQSNLLPAADLSEKSLEDMLIQISQARNNRGLQIKLIGQSLHVHPSEYYNAHRILDSVLQNWTANNAVNVIRDRGLLPGGLKVNHYFEDTDAFFVRTNAMEGMIHFERTPLEFTMDNDFDTDNKKYKAYERYDFGWADFRACFGNQGVTT